MISLSFASTSRQRLPDALFGGVGLCGVGRRGKGLRLVSFLLVGLGLGWGLGLSSSRGATPEPAKGASTTPGSYLDQIVAELHGVAISKAPAPDLAAAVRKVVARNPKQAAAIEAEVLAVERPDMDRIAGLIVGAVIQGLGPDMSEAALTSILKVAIELRRSALLTIVSCGARAVSSCEMVALVVKTAAERPAATEGKDIVPLEHKDVVPLEGKDVVPLEGKDVVPFDGKEIVPLQGQHKEGSPSDDTSEIARTAFEARPDCFTKTLNAAGVQTYPTPIPVLLPSPTPTPVVGPSPTPRPAPTPPVPTNFGGVIKSPAYIDPFPVVPSR